MANRDNWKQMMTERLRSDVYYRYFEDINAAAKITPTQAINSVIQKISTAIDERELSRRKSSALRVNIYNNLDPELYGKKFDPHIMPFDNIDSLANFSQIWHPIEMVEDKPAVSSTFKCPNCGKNTVSIEERQLRRSDEPANMVFSCQTCSMASIT